MRLRNRKWVFTTPEAEEAHNTEVLKRFRDTREFYPRSHVRRAWLRFPLLITLSPELQLPFVTFDHLQDFCNKSIAIYGANTNINTLDCQYMEWMEETSTLIGSWRNTWETAADVEYVRAMDQPQYHKLKPLYRALLMVIEEETEINGEKTLVKLVRIGVTVGLSAPINFEEFGKPNEDVITLTLEQALDLVIRLENKVEEAFPRQDITILHRHLGATPSLKNSGYTDKPIVGPSSDWFKDEV
ncbi:uncharacterized protein PAC_18459 [Phialocephala subalpina]|uniref:Uncharacterized protein n=1 Tax=Phialocephala subalpina TaxID=576137 RepID=A0A1L7XU62_9HELO|nr:uncharacterized protein PAC_18459 [Phialocephala subalpina]